MIQSTSTIAALIPIASLALACTKPQPTDDPTTHDASAQGSLPTPVRPEPAAIAADEAVVIHQIGITNPIHWRTEPGGSRIAAVGFEGDCGVWQLGSGDYLGPANTTEPCDAWAPLEPIQVIDGVAGFAVTHPDGKRQLAVAGDRFELSGGKSITGRLRGDRRYRAAAFSPDGARLALFVAAERGPVEIEVWNLASGRLERELDFVGHGESKATGFTLRWDPQSLVAIVRFTAPPCDPAVGSYCDEELDSTWAHAHVVQVWQSIEAEPTTRELLGEHQGEERVEQFLADPEHRWLFAVVEVVEPRDGGTSFVFAEIPLHDDDDTGLSWWSPTLDGKPGPLDLGKVRQWHGTVGSSFLDVQSYVSESVWASVTWSMTSLTARAIPEAPIELQRSEGAVLEGPVGEHAWRIAMAGRDKVLADLDLCPNEWEIEEATARGEPAPPCEQHRTAPEGCTAIDASWTFDQLLLACGDRWMLAPTPQPQASIDLGQARELGRGTGEPRQVVWGPRGLAIWTFGEGLRLYSGDALAAGQAHTTISDLHRAVLDEELDLALVRERQGLYVADLASGELGPQLAWKQRVEFAAFAPDRSQIAVAGEGELAVFLRSESQPVARWRTGPIAGMAFRQDGEVLYVGGTRPVPELALDPTTGEQVETAQLDRVAFERIAAAELDPSWRWAIEEDGTILRTIDGQAVLLTYDGGISELGWFVGDPGGLETHRVRIGPSSPAPVYDIKLVADQLLRPGLLGEFFAGKPMPRPKLKPPQPPAGSR